MRWRLPERETLLEVGFVAFAALLVGGLIALVSGRVLGVTVRKARYAERAPAPGKIPPERHRNIGNVATR